MERKYLQAETYSKPANNNHNLNQMINNTHGKSNTLTSIVNHAQNLQVQQQQQYMMNSRLKAGQALPQSKGTQEVQQTVATQTYSTFQSLKAKKQELTSIQPFHVPTVMVGESNNNKLLSPRNKNEEAIEDLRTRIPETANIFDVHSRIGNGTFSTVLLATLKKERDMPEDKKRKFAIKHHIPTSHPERIMKELQCMAKIGGSNNVVGINCCIRYNESVAFIMPYMQHDRFQDFYSKMELPELQHYMKNLLVALRHVHKFNVIHRDVKPSNFLYNRRKRQFLLVDFGLAQQVPIPVVQQLNYDAKGLTIGSNINMLSNHKDTKRAHEPEEAPTPEVKRQRCAGPQGDQSLTNGSSTGSNFKMPLKQINEINNTANNHKSPLNADTVASQSLQPGSSHKYNTNRQLANNKCYCYGHPQVCNTCLVKKEIHASRAGTPGYRPPEVLLKYADQTTAVDIWAAGVILLSVMSSVYPFFKANNDYIALAEMVTIFGDRAIRRTAFALDRLVTLSQRTKPLDLRKLCVLFRNRHKFSSAQMVKKHSNADGSCDVCSNCDQYFFNCLCADCAFKTEPFEKDDPFPLSAYDLLTKLLEVNPHQRITAEDALNHAFFSEQPKSNKN